MNTWRDIKTDPPMPDEPVLFTDGSSIFIGRIYHVDKPAVWETYSCRGYSIDGDYPLEGDISLFGISEWQPVTDTWKPEKSADEMFREMGYEKQLEGKYVTLDGENSCIMFFDEDEFAEGYPFVSIERSGGYELDISFDEALAIAQKIREMEANNG